MGHCRCYKMLENASWLPNVSVATSVDKPLLIFSSLSTSKHLSLHKQLLFQKISTQNKAKHVWNIKYISMILSSQSSFITFVYYMTYYLVNYSKCFSCPSVNSLDICLSASVENDVGHYCTLRLALEHWWLRLLNLQASVPGVSALPWTSGVSEVLPPDMGKIPRDRGRSFLKKKERKED